MTKILVVKTGTLTPATITTAIDALLFKRHLYKAGHAAFMNPNNMHLDFAEQAHKRWVATTDAIVELITQLPDKERSKYEDHLPHQPRQEDWHQAPGDGPGCIDGAGSLLSAAPGIHPGEQREVPGIHAGAQADREAAASRALERSTDRLVKLLEQTTRR